MTPIKIGRLLQLHLRGALVLLLAGAAGGQVHAWAQDQQVISLQVRDANGEPIEGCETRLYGSSVPQRRIDTRSTTDEDGSVELRYPAEQITYLNLSLRKPGYVPAFFTWRPESSRAAVPNSFAAQLVKGRELTGLVEDESGKPIKGCTVALSMKNPWPDASGSYMRLASVTTDEKGSWRFEDGPEDPASVAVRISHPDYFSAQATGAPDGTAVVLKQGISVSGRVVDRNGKAVSGALARLGPDRFGRDEPQAQTDDQGHFILKNCEVGKDVITVQAEGHAPQLKHVEIVEGENAVIEFRLAEPNTLRIEVVDVDGRPIENVSFAVDGWQGYRSLEHRGKTDRAGEAVWASAPPDALICDFFKKGYMAARDVACVPGEDVTLVTMYPELVISGRVIDKEAEEFVESFRIIRGQKQSNLREIYWRTNEVHTFDNGRFEFRFDEPMEGWLLQVIAEGYQPKVSRAFKSNEGAVRFHFMLERAPQVTGTVVDVDGNPVEGAQVVVATGTNRVEIANGYLDKRESAAKPVVSGPDGSYSVTLPEDDFYLLIALHDKGFVELAKQDVGDQQTLQLLPWGEVSGRVRLGDRADAGREVVLFAQRPRDGRNYRTVEYDYLTNTNSRGEFQFQRVLPGEAVVSRVTVVDYGRGVLHSPGWQTPIEVVPGTKSEVSIGGDGLTVRGRFALNKNPPAGTRWEFEPAVTLVAYDKKKGTRQTPYTRYSAAVQTDGSFEIQDVPIGDYQIQMDVNALGTQNRIAGSIAKLSTVVSITEEASDLGELVVTLDERLEVGDPLPFFVAETYQGKVIDSRDFSGQVVLLSFWSTYADESQGETALIGAAVKSFVDEPGVRFVSMSTEEQVEASWEEVLQRGWNKHSSHWIHAFAGPRFTKVCKQFHIKSIPANFLIGPDGRVVDKDIPAEEIADRVRQLLEKTDAKVEAMDRKSRLSTKRFDTSEPLAETPQPVVIMLDDADKAFRADDNQYDNLIAFDRDLNELWKLSDLDAYGSGHHRIAIDHLRKRIYVCEAIKDCLLAVDFGGNKLWQVSGLESNCVAVDDKTGNIWVSGGDYLAYGETTVLSPEGTEQFTLPYRAADMIYHPKSERFWLVGSHLIIMDREGKLLARTRVEGHQCSSISFDQASGDIWIAERDHPDVAGSKNRIWVFGANGSAKREFNVGKFDSLTVECQHDGTALMGGFRSGLKHIAADGSLRDLLPSREKLDSSSDDGSEDVALNVRSIAVSSDGTIWAATDDALVRMEEDQVTKKTPIAQGNSATVLAF